MMKRFVLLAVGLFLCPVLWAQDAELGGLVKDPSEAVVPGAELKIRNLATGYERITNTNAAGAYSFPALQPATYEIEVSKQGFQTLVRSNLKLEVAQRATIDFTLKVGDTAQTVTVEGGAPLVNTEDAAVSTVVDRNFAENLPMNGRSFQTLIQLTPGVVLTQSTQQDAGQFSVNGQRPNSNYFTVDGVSANVGMTAVQQQGALSNYAGGALPTFSVQGGTNSLVSVDALEEFRIQTSTYAPEFGRTPGAQISIVTRSGTNRFHGTAFDYLRNDVLDANDWFANRNSLQKPPERQNDFGGTFSGPMFRDRTFFFFSYEGLRLRLPKVAQTTVPSLTVRQTAITAMQPFLNSYPKPTGADLVNAQGTPTGLAPFSASFSNSSNLDAASIRVDDHINSSLTLFGRYNYSPSALVQRPPSRSVNTVQTAKITTQTATLGATWLLSQHLTNDLRFNYSHTASRGRFDLDSFGGAVPLTDTVIGLPSPFTTQDSQFAFQTFDAAPGLFIGKIADNLQQQFNVVDALSAQRGSHGLKYGVDYRRLMPSSGPPVYNQQPFFSSVNTAKSGQLFFSTIGSARRAELLFQNLSAFAQDTWRVLPRLTITYGVRWDIDFRPSTRDGLNLVAVTNFNDLSQLALAPDGTAIFSTKYGNIAPRLGAAFRLFDRPGWETVLRGGWGQFFDLATQEVGAATNAIAFPFGAVVTPLGGTFPYSPAAAAPPAISRSFVNKQLVAFDPDLKLPYSWEWNVALDQGLGGKQALTMSYVGAVGRRLLQSEFIASGPNPNFGSAVLTGNRGTSDYDSLQVQFKRRVQRGMQALASYAWSHSIDTASASSYGSRSNVLTRQLGADATRGPSDFDVRHTFSLGLTYDLPSPKANAFASAILSGWSTENVVQARTAPPVDVLNSSLKLFANQTAVRPDLVPGVPLYLFGPQYPGHKALNPAAFTNPPLANGQPTREGNLSRNALRGFGAWQWDFAVHRDFPLRESLKLQFRAEMFNVLNHPNFAAPISDLNNRAQFGMSTQTLANGFAGNGNLGGGAFNPLYQMGGPRSAQLALKLVF